MVGDSIFCQYFDSILLLIARVDQVEHTIGVKFHYGRVQSFKDADDVRIAVVLSSLPVNNISSFVDVLRVML